MPFSSVAQQRACFASGGFGGKIDCREWASKTDFKKLPQKKKKEKSLYTLPISIDKAMGEGEAEKKGITREDVDPKQLKMGIEVEKEHTKNKHLAEEIALDHLAEYNSYYTHLKKMEDELKAIEKGGRGSGRHARFPTKVLPVKIYSKFPSKYFRKLPMKLMRAAIPREVRAAIPTRISKKQAGRTLRRLDTLIGMAGGGVTGLAIAGPAGIPIGAYMMGRMSSKDKQDIGELITRKTRTGRAAPRTTAMKRIAGSLGGAAVGTGIGTLAGGPIGGAIGGVIGNIIGRKLTKRALKEKSIYLQYEEE